MLKSKIFTALFIALSISALAGNPSAKKDGTTGIQFFNGTFKEALAKAKKENKMVMMDCYTTWCGPCKMLKKQVFVDKKLGDYMNAKYVCVAMDYENGEGPEIAQKYPVEGYPTLYFMDSAGKVKKTMVGVPPNAINAVLAMAKKVGK
jgi:thioredoxin 1